jgi:SAM-dependent methyltransferase
MKIYQPIIDRYERCLQKHGNSCKGVDWPNEQDEVVRYAVMLKIVENPEATLLDLGCGTGRMLGYLKEHWPQIRYTGLDASLQFIEAARKTHPGSNFVEQDILDHPLTEKFDYVVMNGVLTVKDSLTWIDMWGYSKDLITAAWSHAQRGMAFNVMSKHVDWERSDLFHLPFDDAASFVRTLTKNFSFRQDYGLYEYTIYLHR